jgi:metal-dependent amidase/aminoacylase/carboxypeptidase family protein
MKISRRATHQILPKAMFAVCTAGILAGSASAAGTMPSATKTLRQQRQQARYEQRLEKAVTSGKLTSAQEQAVLAEHNLLKAQLQAATPGTRKQVNQEVQNEAKSWAQQHGINIRWLLPRWHHHKAKA